MVQDGEALTAYELALAACREEWLAYFHRWLVVLVTPDGDALTRRADQAVPWPGSGVIADFAPFLLTVLGDSTPAAVRACLPGIARALACTGDLSDAQILQAAGDHFRRLRRTLDRLAAPLPA